MSIFKLKHKKPKERTLYAITNGTMMGTCVIFIKPNDYPKNGHYAAMAIGDKNMDGGMDALQIPEKDVLEGFKLGILDQIRKVPKELYNLCCEEYNFRIKKKESENDEPTN